MLIYLLLKSTMKNGEERMHCHTTRLKSEEKKQKKRVNISVLCTLFSLLILHHFLQLCK